MRVFGTEMINGKVRKESMESMVGCELGKGMWACIRVAWASLFAYYYVSLLGGRISWRSRGAGEQRADDACSAARFQVGQRLPKSPPKSHPNETSLQAHNPNQLPIFN